MGVVARPLSARGLIARAIIGSGGSAPAPSFDPLAAFDSGTYVGFLYNPRVAGNLFQLSNGTTAVTNGDPVGYDTDLTGNGNHATQPISGSRPTFPGLAQDGADDMLWVFDSLFGGHDFTGFGDNGTGLSFMARCSPDNASASVSLASASLSIASTLICLREQRTAGAKIPFCFGFNGGKVKLGFSNSAAGANRDKAVTSTATISNGSDITVGASASFALVGGNIEIQWAIYVDGSLDSSGTMTINDTPPVSVGSQQSNLTIGSATSDAGAPLRYLQGDRGPSVFINRALTADDFADYHTWMMS